MRRSRKWMLFQVVGSQESEAGRKRFFSIHLPFALRLLLFTVFFFLTTDFCLSLLISRLHQSFQFDRGGVAVDALFGESGGVHRFFGDSADDQRCRRVYDD
jgi:hypothetical protein